MGLAWLSLFFSWNVNMVVEAHKVFKKKRRHRHRHFYDEEPEPEVDKSKSEARPSVIDIFDFPKEEDYSTIIKEIGAPKNKTKTAENINRSKSCNDILANNIQTLDHSPRHKRLISISEVFMNVKPVEDTSGQKDKNSLSPESKVGPEPTEHKRSYDEENKDSCSSDSEPHGIIFTVLTQDASEEESVQHPSGGETRFKISKVAEEDCLMHKDENG